MTRIFIGIRLFFADSRSRYWNRDIRWKKNNKSQPESVSLACLDELLMLAMELFGTEQIAREWLETRIPVLGNRTPMERLDAEVGCVLVINTLDQIAWGAPA